jgi:PAS domain S-box-containing protein
MHGRNPGSNLVPLGLRELLDTSPDPLIACDADGTLLWLNRAFESLTGRAVKDLVGQSWATLVPPRVLGHVARAFLRQRRRGMPLAEVVLPLISSQGSEVWVTARVSLLDRKGAGTVFVGTTRELTADMRAKALAVTSSVPGPAEVVLPVAPSVAPAPPAPVMTLTAPTPVRPPPAATEMPAAGKPAARKERRRRGGIAAALDLLLHGSGAPSAPRAAQAPPASASAPDPVPAATSETGSDPAVLRRCIEELTAERDEARGLAQAKSDLLATMSHEFRTPMNGMMGMAHLLLETEMDGEQRGMVEVVLHSGQALLALVNDTLDFSRVEAGKLELERMPFDLRLTTNEVGALLGPLANDKGLHFECQVHHEVPSRVWGDPGRLRQVLLNLGGNAVKFTEQGEVRLAVDRLREDERCVTLRFSMSDTGIGMTEDQRSRIFQAYTQADATIARRFGGTGLGLAISSRLVSLMGGTVGVESRPGEGSRFRFDLTFEKQVEPAVPVAAPSPGELMGLRVLVVDPSTAMRRSFETRLPAWGCRVECAENAERALDLLHRAAEAADPYRLALIERELPDMNGEELGAAIRADGAHDGTLTVLMLAVGRRGDAARARARGFSAYLSKPLDWEELAGALAEVLHLARVTPTGEAAPLVTRHSLAEARRSRLRILLVEDSAVNQLVTDWTLRRLGYGLLTAATVAAAISACDQERFDLVLLDLQLPDGDGFEVARVLRSREIGGRRVPIVAMTGSDEPEDRRRCLDEGMDEYVTKPVDLGLLCRVVERLTSAALPPESPATGEEAPGEASPAEVPLVSPSREELDPEKVEIVVDDRPLLRAVEAAEADIDGLHRIGAPRPEAIEPREYRTQEVEPDEAAAIAAAAEAAQFEATETARFRCAEAERFDVAEVEPPAAVGSAAEAVEHGPDPQAVARLVPPLATRESAGTAAPEFAPLSVADVVPLEVPAAEDAAEDPGAQVPLDLERLDMTCMGIAALRETMLNTFLSDVRPRLERLGQALAEGDAHRVEFEAHGLKGMCATVGVTICAGIFMEIERAGREQSLDGVPSLLKRGYVEVTRAEQFITTMERMAA